MISCSNCTSLQWWNGSYCREKGFPSWGVNSSDICNDTYQCADYNLVSCPLSSTCECATTKYWVGNLNLHPLRHSSLSLSFQNGLTCLDRVFNGQTCTVWQTAPVNTTTCLSAAGAGLLCNGGGCSGGICTGGTCGCPVGTTWNATFLICASPPPPG